jgi:hypothetical protein
VKTKNSALLAALALAGCTVESAYVDPFFDIDSAVTLDASAPDAATADGGDAGSRLAEAGAAPDAFVMNDVGTDAGVDAWVDRWACASADLGSALGPSVAADTTDGMAHLMFTGCGSSSSSGDDVVYRWTAPTAGAYRIEASPDEYDDLLTIVAADCSSTTPLACEDYGPADIALAEGETVLVVVKGYSSSAAGPFTLSIRPMMVEDCHDGADNDADDDVDCADSECSRVPECIENCSDGLDNDADGSIDCRDSNCNTDPLCIETNCTNGVDDDNDGAADCRDTSCRTTAVCREVCNDSMDNDVDGSTDCADSDCRSAPGCIETSCSNRTDDDRDGRTDCADTDCSGEAYCRETNCGDGRDDELDGATDCADSDCARDRLCVENCTDGVDNDRDGDTDCFDSQCSTECRANCSSSPPPSMCPEVDLGSAVGVVEAMGRIAYGCSTMTPPSTPSLYCYSSGPENSYSWTAPTTGNYRVRVRNPGARFDAVVVVQSACTGATLLACNDTALTTGVESEATFSATMGTTYIVVVEAYSSTGGGVYSLEFTAL